MWSSCHKHRTKKKSESPTGIEPMTFRTPVRCSIILYLLNRSKSKWMFVVWNFNIPWRAASHYQTSQVSRFWGQSQGLMMRHKNLTVNRFTSWWNTLFEYVHFCLVKLIFRHQFVEIHSSEGYLSYLIILLTKVWTSKPYLEDKCQIRLLLPVCRI